jgi:hypothetical protein
MFTIGATGQVSAQNLTNSATAFQIQDAAGSQLFSANTTNPITDVTNNQLNNEITNGSFEGANGTTGWATQGAGTTITQDASQSYVGNDALNITTTATAAAGAKFALSASTLVANTAYTLTLYARSFNNGNNMSTLQIGWFDNAAHSCLTAQTVQWVGWTEYNCTFTTGATIASPYIYVEQTDATARTFWIDGVQLQRFSILSNASAEVALAAGDWSNALGGATITQSAAQHEDGTHSVSIAATSTVGSGVKHPITLTPSTTYNLYFFAYTAASFSTMEVGYNNGTSNFPCLTAQPVTAGQWSYYQCSFTTPASNSGTPFMYFDKEDGVAHTWFIDAVQLTQGQQLTTFEEGQLSLDTTINSPTVLQNTNDSTNAFAVQNALGDSDFNVDTTNNVVTLDNIAQVTNTGGTQAFYFANNLTTPTNAMRFRTNSFGTNVESGGSTMYLSVWPTAGMTSDQAIFAEGVVSNGDLQVGNGGGSGNDITGTPSPTLLLLDQTSSTPTEIDGGMYYNPSDDGFECGENGTWDGCSSLVESTTAQSSTNVTSTGAIESFGQPYTEPANDCEPGVVFLIHASGYYQEGGGGAPFPVSLYLSQDGNELLQWTSLIYSMTAAGTVAKIAAGHGYNWNLDSTITCDSTTTAMVAGTASFQDYGDTSNASGGTFGAQTGAITWSAAGGSTIDIGGTWVGTSSTTFKMNQFAVQRLAP